jgi:digeranylgeranylglycerophospholipid reductase
MRKTSVDIAIVGGGPAGAMTAKTAAEAGVEVLLIEEDSHVGEPVQCTGLVSTRTLEEGSVGLGVVVREIAGVSVHGPGGSQVAIDGGKTKACVIDRAMFDRELIKQAAAVGVRVMTGVQAVGLQGDCLTVKEKGQEGSKREVKATVIVGADGPYSRIRTWAELSPPRRMLNGLQAVVPYSPERGDFVEVFLGKDIAPGFFAWCVPASDGIARIGLASNDGRQLSFFLERILHRKGLAPGKDNLECIGGTITIGPPPRTVNGNVLIVGDAAGQAKPTSGGGIYTGIICAKIAGEVAAKAVRNNDISILGEYEVRWRERLERELRFGMLAHRILGGLDDHHLERLLAAINEPNTLKAIAKYGDIDYPSRLLRYLRGQPRLWRRFAPLLPDVLLGMLRKAVPSYIGSHR